MLNKFLMILLLCVSCEQKQQTTAEIAPQIIITPAIVAQGPVDRLIAVPTPPSLVLFGWEFISNNAAVAGYYDTLEGNINLHKYSSQQTGVVGVQKTFNNVSMADNTAITAIVSLQAAEGANLYLNFYINGVIVAEVGVNGYNHWTENQCMEKTFDDEFFIGFAGNNLGYLSNSFNTTTWTNDVRVATPVLVDFSTPTSFTVALKNGYWHFYINGLEAIYRDIGNYYPLGGFNTKNTIPFSGGNNTLMVQFELLGDGSTYQSYPFPCTTDSSPFVPGLYPMPSYTSATLSSLSIYSP